MNKTLAIFENHKIRRHFDEETETWLFSVVDIVQILIQQSDYQVARNYWKVLKNRLAKEGSQSVTNCNRLKLEAADGKKYLTDVANAETLLRHSLSFSRLGVGGTQEAIPQKSQNLRSVNINDLVCIKCSCLLPAQESTGSLRPQG